MSCQHNNPTFHRFCVVCGSRLQRINCPRCSAVCDSKHLFCHACGESLHQAPSHDTPAVMLAQTYNLDVLLQSPVNNAVKIEKSAGKMTQDEIKKLLAARQKKS